MFEMSYKRNTESTDDDYYLNLITVVLGKKCH